MRTDGFYARRLQAYFDRHYGQYDESAEWFTDVAANQWKFRIPELKRVVTLICDDNGRVSEGRAEG